MFRTALAIRLKVFVNRKERSQFVFVANEAVGKMQDEIVLLLKKDNYCRAVFSFLWLYIARVLTMENFDGFYTYLIDKTPFV